MTDPKLQITSKSTKTIYSDVPICKAFGYVDSDKKFVALNRSNGQLLIESGVAISVLVVGLLGIFGLLSRSLSINNIVSSRYIASNLAAEGVEVVKNLIDGNIVQLKPWNQGINTGSYEAAFDSLALNPNQDRFLLFDSTGNTYNYSIGQPTPYKRTIQIANIGSDEIKVSSAVNWQIKGGSYSVNLEDHFFNWRKPGAAKAGAGVNDVNLVILPETTHGFTGGSSGHEGVYSMDSDFATYQGDGAYVAGASSGVGPVPTTMVSYTMVSEHTFASPKTLSHIDYRLYYKAKAGGPGGIRTYSYNVYVATKVGGVWTNVPGSASSGSGDGNNGPDTDTGTITYTYPSRLSNVEAVKAYIYVTSSATIGGYVDDAARIYEIQAWGR